MFVFRAVTKIVTGVRYKRRFHVEPEWTPNTIKVGAMFGQGQIMPLLRDVGLKAVRRVTPYHRNLSF